MKTTLTVKESARIIELGIDPQLASSVKYEETGRIRCGIELPPEPRPIFTLTDILSILPKEIYSKKGNIFYSLTMVTQMFPLNSSAYYAHSVHGKFSPRMSTPELIDALYQLLIWTIENNYINTENHGRR